MKKKKYAVTLYACTTIKVEANSPKEAEQIALDDFKGGKNALIFDIDQNGYDAECDDDLTDELEEECV